MVIFFTYAVWCWYALNVGQLLQTSRKKTMFEWNSNPIKTLSSIQKLVYSFISSLTRKKG